MHYVQVCEQLYTSHACVRTLAHDSYTLRIRIVSVADVFPNKAGYPDTVKN